MNNNEKAGAITERLVLNHLGGTLSEDKYDEDKDIILKDGTFVEVKTQVRYKKENAFTIDQTPTNNNLHKCLKVDRLIFVEIGKGYIIRFF